MRYCTPAVAAVLIVAVARRAACQPANWVPAIAQGDLLYANSDENVALMPLLGNGFLGTIVNSTDLYVSGLFNGYLTVTPSHRARLPTPLNIFSTDLRQTAAGLSLRNATYLRQLQVPPVPGCSVSLGVSCTSAPSAVTVEQRLYAHRANATLLVHEIAVLSDGGWSGGGGPFLVLQLSSNWGLPSLDVLLVEVQVPGVNASVWNGSTWTAETNTSGVQGVAFAADPVPSAFEMPTPSSGSPLFVMAVRTTVETAASALVSGAVSDYRWARQQSASALWASHVAAWADLWVAGVEVDNLTIAVATNASLYAILSAIRADRPLSISPGALTNGYNGHTFWDCETWMFPGVLALYPGLAQSLLQYRVDRLPGAMEKAASYAPPYAGAMFPWESAWTGVETCPSWAATGLREIHISGDIAFATLQYFRATGDVAWLRSSGWPLVSGIATFWLSKASADTAALLGAPHTPRSVLEEGAPLHITGVIGPDEYHDFCPDEVYTNEVARASLQVAVETATLLGVNASNASAWAQAAQNIVQVFNASGQYHPEFANYTGDTVKQADVILTAYPLNAQFGAAALPAVRANDLAYYSPRTDPEGPAMTWSMTAIGLIELGQVSAAQPFFTQAFANNVNAPFAVWSEVVGGGGTPQFVTGAGGFLQAMIFGWTGLRFLDQGLALNAAGLPDGASFLRLRALGFAGAQLSVTVSPTGLAVAQTLPSPYGPLFLTDLTSNTTLPLHTGAAPLALPANTSALLHLNDSSIWIAARRLLHST